MRLMVMKGLQKGLNKNTGEPLNLSSASQQHKGAPNDASPPLYLYKQLSEAVTSPFFAFAVTFMHDKTSELELLQARLRHFVQAQCCGSAPDIRDIPLLPKLIFCM